MKKLLRIFVLAVGLASLGGCSESEYDIPNLFPEEYHKILYILQSGEHQETLYITGSTMQYQYAVVKSGSDPTMEAEVNMRVMSQEEVDTKWSDLTGIPHYVLPVSSYTLSETNLKFTSEDAFKNLNITINPAIVEAFIEEQKTNNPEDASYMKFVLPILAEGATTSDSINSLKNYVMLTVADIMEPTIGFEDTNIHKQFIGQSDKTINIPVNLEVANQWDFTSRVVVDEAYVDAYNAKNGTNYLPFPNSAIEFPETVSFTVGKQGILPVKVNYSKLTSSPTMDKNYMVALKLEMGELFGVSQTKSHYVMATAYQMPDRSSWTWKVNSESSSEGTNGWLTNVYDDKSSTYWHSNYGNGNGVVNLLPYIFTIDMKEVRTVTQFGLYGRQHASNSDLKTGFFEASSDGVNWTQIGTFQVAKGIQPETICPVTPTATRYLRMTITESHRSQNSAVGELYVYGY